MCVCVCEGSKKPIMSGCESVLIYMAFVCLASSLLCTMVCVCVCVWCGVHNGVGVQVCVCVRAHTMM